MKVSESWLREFVNPKISSCKLSAQISMLGFEVYSSKKKKINFKKFIIGKILKFKVYSINKKIYIIKIDIGKKKFLNIFSKKKKLKKKMKIFLYKKNISNFDIEKKYLLDKFGNISENKIFSLKKIKIEFINNKRINNNNYINKFKKIENYFNVNDNLFDISIPHNRSDCLSLIGIAREISAKNKIPIIYPKILNNNFLNKNLKIKFNIKENNSCFKYLLRIIKNINVKSKTPQWIIERLKNCDIKLENCIKNIINYVQIEFGQPFNVFDLDKIKNKIIIRYASDKEKIKLIDGTKINLSKKILVVSDNKKIISIVGIINNYNYEIKSNTKNIILECALYNKLSILDNIKYCNFNKTNNNIYEREIDTKIQKYALNRLTYLITIVCGGTPSCILCKKNKNYFSKKKKIFISRKKINKIIGNYIPDININNILTRLGFKKKKNKFGWTIISPTWRNDILIEEDIIEEICRIYGYDNIKKTPYINKNPIKFNKNKYISFSKIKNFLLNRGYQEVINYSFINKKEQNIIFPNKSYLKILNPLSKDMSVMRISLLTGLIKTAIYNIHHQQKRIKLFESGLCFIPDVKYKNKIKQKFFISGIIIGPIYNEYWDKKNQYADFYDIKGDIESIFEINNQSIDITFKECNDKLFHPGKSSKVYFKNKKIAYFGFVNPNILKYFNLNYKTLVFEIFLNKLYKKNKFKINSVSMFPYYYRDISCIVFNKIKYIDIISECKKNLKNKLIDITLLDIYEGPEIKDGFKSFSIRLTLQDLNRTLNKNEISKMVNNCVKKLILKFKKNILNINLNIN
ncbi:MAG: phenylalanine--tRNA ligase subunit beta [Candidatus Makana argininalis]